MDLEINWMVLRKLGSADLKYGPVAWARERVDGALRSVSCGVLVK
jgi:hypothetical protein